MARRRKPNVDPAMAAMDKFAAPKKKAGKQRRRYEGASAAHRAACIQEVHDRIKRQDWAGVTPSRLVGVYWVCHEKVYQCTPVELDKADVWARATLQAGRMVRDQFDGDIQKFVVFMRWVWSEEQRKEQWRRERGFHGKRITWQNQFIHDYLISDWRAAAARRRGG